jgi:predicted signal transduction protein with EAL and GGDEF domain
LVEVAERLLDCVRVNDSVARLGGDEFAILLEGLGGRAEVSTVAGRICESLRAPFRLGDREVFLGGSIGIAGSTGGGDDTADTLLRNADLAMYEAKAEQNGSYRWYEPIMHLSVLRRLELDGDMRRSIERGELFLEYQPIIDLASGTVTGAEALVRWAHPTRGVVSPADFIPVAEANGLVAAIGEWVVDEACRQLRQWQDRRTGRPLTMSVNLSGRQLDRRETAGVVSDALERWGLDPAHLVLEMTETIFIGHTERTLGNLRSLKELGVRLAVDDFGTGYSNLSYLHRLPVDVIKIDKLFVDRLTAQPGEAGLAASIVRIGQDLHLVTVAEGVEHRFQLDVLRSIGCDQGQGNLLARPVRPAAFEALLDENGRLIRTAGSRSERP